MNEELVLVASLLIGAIAMIVGIVTWQRRTLRQLERSDTIELPVESVWRTVVVVLAAALIVPITVGVVGALTDPWLRAHALGAVLTSVFGAGASIVGGLVATKRWRRIGMLRATTTRIELQVAHVVNGVDLDRPFTIEELRASGPQDMPMQVVIVEQDGRRWAFSYGTGTQRVARGDVVALGECPMLDNAACLVHDRLIAAQAGSVRVPVAADDVVTPR